MSARASSLSLQSKLFPNLVQTLISAHKKEQEHTRSYTGGRGSKKKVDNLYCRLLNAVRHPTGRKMSSSKLDSKTKMMKGSFAVSGQGNLVNNGLLSVTVSR